MLRCIFCQVREVMQDRAACAECYRERFQKLVEPLLAADPRFAVPPHPQVLAVAKESLDFESAMLSLASCVPCDLPALTEAFKQFAASRPWPWRDAVSYCRAYFYERGRFPFEIEEWPEVIGE